MFKKKVSAAEKAANKNTVSLVLYINERLIPEHRYWYYEDTISPVLKKYRLGKLVGGESMMTKENGVECCELSFECPRRKLNKLVNLLSIIPLAKGSRITVFGDDGKEEKEIEVGKLECMGIRLNGTELPDEIYKSCTSDYVVDELMKILGEENVLYTYWHGDTDMLLFFYGESYEEMRDKVSEFLDTYPLCQDCTVEQVA